MKRAAIGIRAHSGWAALVAVSRKSAAVHVIDRRRIEVVAPHTAGAKQPYHFATELKPHDAEEYIARCAADADRLALAGLAELVADVRREYEVAGCAILLAAGRPLPPLPQILASHSLIHTAEGEFFRRVFWKASESLKIPVTGIQERELDPHVESVFGARAVLLKREIAGLGKLLGPPWTADQKHSALAALLFLADGQRTRRPLTKSASKPES